MTTVQQLIERLKQFPPETEVVQRMYSEFDYLDPEDVRLIPAEEKKFIRHNGKYLVYVPSHYPKDDVVEFVTVVCFPGN